MEDVATATETTATETQETTTATETTATAQTGNWYDGIEGVSDKDRESKSIGDYVKSTNALRTMIDKKGIIPPGEGSTDEERAQFKSAVEQHLGADAFKPEIPAIDSYDVKALVENNALTDERRAGIFEDFNKIGLTNDQANGVMELFGKQSGLDVEMIKEFNDSSRKESETLYKEEWGGDFADRLAAADEIAAKNPELLAKLEKVGLGGDKDVIRFFDEIARATSEDSPENSEARKANATTDYQEYINSSEYKSMVALDSPYSAGMPEYDAVLEKARALMAKTL